MIFAAVGALVVMGAGVLVLGVMGARAASKDAPHAGPELLSWLYKERAVADRVPYRALLSDHNIRLRNGDIATAFRVAGVAHESADEEMVASWHESLSGLLRNIADPELAVWTHMVRRKQSEFPGGAFEPGFADDLNARYRELLSRGEMMVNDLYLTLVLRGPREFGKRRSVAEVAAEMGELSERLDQIAGTVAAGLDRYGPQRLGTYTLGAMTRSELLEFIALLVNGEHQPVALPRGSAATAVCSSRLSFGVESLEVRTPVGRDVAAIVSINDYPEGLETGAINVLMSLPFGFVLAQSFAFIDRTKALNMIQTQQRKLINAKDAGQSQVEQLSEAADDVVSGRLALGTHHLSVLVSAKDGRSLESQVAHVRSNLSEAGFVAVREDTALEAAYWAQLPGVFDFRPRPAPITTRNFAALNPLHNYPAGRASGNEWGDAVTLLKTVSGTPFYFNFHLPSSRRPSGPSTETDRVSGNTMIIGPTGAGKTVVQTFMLAQAEKYRPTVFTFDKDRGQEIFIRAMGGRYSVLRNGHPTGFNPYQMEPTPQNVQFLVSLTKKLIRPYFGSEGHGFTAHQESEIAKAVEGLLQLPLASRRLTVLRQFLSGVDAEDGAGIRLAKWCEGGMLGWVFDNATDSIDLTQSRYFGFDVTDFLDNDEVRTPIIMYLFHRMEALIDGRRFIMNMDEFWKMLLDPLFQAKIEDWIKTIRKRNGIALFGTQSPKDVLRTPIAHSLIEQCKTQVFMPNPKASAEDYVDGFKLTEREWQIVRNDMPASRFRGFLYKQDAVSAVCELNLAGFDDELAVLSGTAASTRVCEDAIERAGSIDPALWLPVFHALRRGA